MLLELFIQNIALVEKLELQLGPGLIVLTGETGAGKSIILDALGLLLGNRAAMELIRNGTDRAFVEGMFSVERKPEIVARLLTEWGVPFDEPQVVISRELHASGRAVCRVNGHMVTVQMLRQLGRHLLQQHGQHDQHGLLRVEEQMQMLDLYAKHENLIRDVGVAYKSWREATAEFKSLSMDEQERSRQLDMLQFQVDEIEGAVLQPGEEEPLREERKRLQFMERIISHVEGAVRLLDDAGSQAGAVAGLATAAREIASAAAYDQGLGESLELLETAQVHAEEASRALGTYLGGLEADPRRIEEIENRFALIRNLERKYGASVEDVLAYLEEARTKRNQLLNYEQRGAEAEQQVTRAKVRLDEACLKLHHSRERSARELGNRIEEVLRQLDIPSAVFQVCVEQGGTDDRRYSPRGFDSVQFLFSANRGEEQRPLSRIASGGELSRTLLAMKSVLSEVDDVNALVFDEIDAGVSGSAAVRIADRLMQLGRRGQVLCITHAAPIAASATMHWEIVKKELGETTRTMVVPLDDEGRVREIARLLGSEGTGETATEHARALLESRKHLSM